MNIKGKKVLITGGAVRIGKALALALSKKGMEILLHYNTSEKKALVCADEIKKEGGKVTLFQKNLSSEKAVLELFETLKENQMVPDILINSASIFEKDQFNDTKEETLKRNMMINSYVPHWLSRELSKHGTAGHIINFLDTRISSYDSEHLSYHLSKRNLYTLTKLTALELAPRFRVNAVAPGAILPPEGLDNNYLINRAAETPLGVPGSVKEVVDTVLFLINAETITGQIIYLDGGHHLKGALYGT